MRKWSFGGGLCPAAFVVLQGLVFGAAGAPASQGTGVPGPADLVDTRGSGPGAPDLELKDVRQATIQLSPETVARAADQLGAWGCLAVRGADRWEALRQTLKRLGWEEPAAFPLAHVDWNKELVVCVFDCGDEGNAFSLRRLGGDDKVREVGVAMSYVIYKQRDKAIDRCKMILVAVPRSALVRVSVSTYHPSNGGENASPEKAALEWSTLFDGAPRAGNGDSGDVVGNLQGRIEPQAPAARAGEDISVKFQLQSAAGDVVRAGAFARDNGPVFVWDGKYSNGYRNHAFLVKGPDGNTHVLRPVEIRDWDKNAPHPVRVAPGSPYDLPEWGEGEVFKSLQTLGLDTSAPGVYEITGIYSETAGAGHNPDVHVWSGEIWTNTVVVEVKKK